MALRLNGMDIVVSDVDATVAFYRSLGVDIPDEAVWRPKRKAHHVEIRSTEGFGWNIDSLEMTTGYLPDWQAGRDNIVLFFQVEDRTLVDDTFKKMTAAGYGVMRPPFEAFWGSRYAILKDPDGNNVGVMGPRDRDHGEGPALDD